MLYGRKDKIYFSKNSRFQSLFFFFFVILSLRKEKKKRKWQGQSFRFCDETAQKTTSSFSRRPTNQTMPRPQNGEEGLDEGFCMFHMFSLSLFVVFCLVLMLLVVL